MYFYTVLSFYMSRHQLPRLKGWSLHHSLFEIVAIMYTDFYMHGINNSE